MKPDDECGLLIDRANQHGTEYVTVHVVRRREQDGDVPLGCSGDGEMYLGYGCLLGKVKSSFVKACINRSKI